MKNNNDQHYEIRKAREAKMHRVTTDVLVNPAVIERNISKLVSKPRRKRNINYTKKILNDPFIFNV